RCGFPETCQHLDHADPNGRCLLSSRPRRVSLLGSWRRALIVLLPHPRAENYKRIDQEGRVAEPLLSGAADHVAQLAGLGLRLEYFYDALRAGEQARRLVTE